MKIIMATFEFIEFSVGVIFTLVVGTILLGIIVEFVIDIFRISMN